MIGKENESGPTSTQEPSSLRPKIPSTLEELLLYLGYCLLDGPLPADAPLPTLLENERIKAVRDRAHMWLEEAYRLRHPEITQQEIAAWKTQDEKLWRYLETEQNLKKRGIPEKRSVFHYLRERGVKQPKKVESLTEAMKKAGLDLSKYAEQRAKVEMFSRPNPKAPPWIKAYNPAAEVFIKAKPDIDTYAEPPRVSTLMLDAFIKSLIEPRAERKKAKLRARVQKARKKA